MCGAYGGHVGATRERGQMKPKFELILYQTEDHRTRIEARLEDETVWLTLNQLAGLFQRDKSVISKHIRNVLAEGELQPEATVAKYATVQTEGGREISRAVKFYNLDAAIPAGHRVNSVMRTTDPAESDSIRVNSTFQIGLGVAGRDKMAHTPNQAKLPNEPKSNLPVKPSQT